MTDANGKAVKAMRSSNAALWRVIYIASGEQQAQQIEDMLRGAGFLIDRRRVDGQNARTEDIEIRSLDSEAGEARFFLMEHGL